MRATLSYVAWGGLLAALLVAGCGRATPPVVQLDDIEVDGVGYRLSGPYAHENLVVFLVHGQDKDNQDYLTLDQGLKDDVVKVTEKAEGAQVNQLTIDNKSDRPLFLQDGDRIIGGQQDRTVVTSLVIPPKSGEMPIPTMCVEAGRWTPGSRGQAFACAANAAFAPKEVRQAAKLGKDQQAVWANVADKKKQAEEKLMTKNTESSLTEAFDSEQVKKVSDNFAEALKDCLAKNPDAVGVAIVVNGKIEEVNIYPNHALLSRLYPRLVQAYAFQATVEKDKAKDAPACSKGDVAEFVTKGKDRQPQPAERINGDNSLHISCVDDSKTECRTEYKGQPVHQQFINAVQPAKPAQPPQPSQNLNPDNVGRQQPAQPPAPSK